MVRILAISDEVDELFGPQAVATLQPDLIVSCGDLPFDYLEYVMTLANVPLLYVPGNHDPEVRHMREATRSPIIGVHGLLLTASRNRPESLDEERRPGGPAGATSVDGRIAEVAGLRVAGLGGSHRYSTGPNQFTQAQMRRRALGLEIRSRVSRPGRGVDVLVTHAPPFGLGDETDRPHVGFASFHRLVRKLRPKLLIHGHIHPYGEARPDRMMGETRVVNVIPYKLLELAPMTATPRNQPRGAP